MTKSPQPPNSAECALSTAEVEQLYFQHIGDGCDRREMNRNSGHRCVWAQRLKSAAILHAEAGASVR